MDGLILFAQAVLTAGIGAWMVRGALDNWRYPDLNIEAVRMVIQFDLMAQAYPDDYAKVAHRRINNPRITKALFALIVVWETLAATLLSIGAVLLMAALLGAVDPVLARTIAALGALAFVTNWAGFLIGGDYFCYWYCHLGSQTTHFLLAIWGSLVVLVLVLPG